MALQTCLGLFYCWTPLLAKLALAGPLTVQMPSTKVLMSRAAEVWPKGAQPEASKESSPPRSAGRLPYA